MARDFKRANKLAVISDLNVTPLIDLAFSLLIIFMITTPVIEQYNRVDLPEQQSADTQAPPEKKDKFITIDAEGVYHWGNDPIGETELGAKLDEIMTATGEQPTIHAVLGETRVRIFKEVFFRLVYFSGPMGLPEDGLRTKLVERLTSFQLFADWLESISRKGFISTVKT